jgi:hypothetical protein
MPEVPPGVGSSHHAKWRGMVVSGHSAGEHHRLKAVKVRLREFEPPPALRLAVISQGHREE